MIYLPEKKMVPSLKHSSFSLSCVSILNILISFSWRNFIDNIFLIFDKEILVRIYFPIKEYGFKNALEQKVYTDYYTIHFIYLLAKNIFLKDKKQAIYRYLYSLFPKSICLSVSLLLWCFFSVNIEKASIFVLIQKKC